jgi:methylenetetrahydrofolate dehydrogenase (NADP+) / methenyltetrahydrofolate cyclohydrolase
MLIDGKQIAQNILDNLKIEIQEKNITPKMAVIILGSDPSSLAYIKQKQLKSEYIGAKCEVTNFDLATQGHALRSYVDKLNNDQTTHGIIIQRPLPPQINSQEVGEWVIPEKDIDGFNSQTKFIPPVAQAILEILKSVNTYPQDKKIVVLGRGETAGFPIASNLIQNGAIVTICHSKTPNISEFTKKADIVISCVGKPNIVRREMLNKDCILIGVGMHKNEEGKLRADFIEEEIKDYVKYYTPVPGGVGPINVACLLKNLFKSTIL